MTFTVDWFTGYIPAWEATFKKTKVPENILEIGSFEGRSTCWLLENTNARITCVDTWEGSDEHTPELKDGLLERFRENIEPYKDRVTLCRGFSGEVLRKFECVPTFDFIYIDGSITQRMFLKMPFLHGVLPSPEVSSSSTTSTGPSKALIFGT